MVHGFLNIICDCGDLIKISIYWTNTDHENS